MILNALYEAIMARLFDEAQADLGIKHFDLFFNQFMTEEEELPFRCPAVLFQYNPLQFETLGNKRQESDVLFTLHIGSTVISEASKAQPPLVRAKAHAHLVLLDGIYKRLQGWRGDGFGTLSRTALDPYEPSGMRIIHKMTFKTRAWDDAAIKTYEKLNPQPTPKNITTVNL